VLNKLDFQHNHILKKLKKFPDLQLPCVTSIKLYGCSFSGRELRESLAMMPSLTLKKFELVDDFNPPDLSFDAKAVTEILQHTAGETLEVLTLRLERDLFIGQDQIGSLAMFTRLKEVNISGECLYANCDEDDCDCDSAPDSEESLDYEEVVCGLHKSWTEPGEFSDLSGALRLIDILPPTLEALTILGEVPTKHLEDFFEGFTEQQKDKLPKLTSVTVECGDERVRRFLHDLGLLTGLRTYIVSNVWTFDFRDEHIWRFLHDLGLVTGPKCSININTSEFKYAQYWKTFAEKAKHGKDVITLRSVMEDLAAIKAETARYRGIVQGC
jgi:hypothetical protein